MKNQNKAWLRYILPCILSFLLICNSLFLFMINISASDVTRSFEMNDQISGQDAAHQLNIKDELTNEKEVEFSQFQENDHEIENNSSTENNEEGFENTDESEEFIESDEEYELDFSVDDLNENDVLIEDDEYSVFPDESGLMLISEENTDFISALDPESEMMLEMIENGDAIGMVIMDNVDLEEGIVLQTEEEIMDMEELGYDVSDAEFAEDDIITLESEVLLSSLTDVRYKINAGNRIFCDEVWTSANDYANGNATRMATVYRTVTYTDLNGTSRTAPIYCMNAMKDGLNSMTLGTSGIKNATNQNIRKVLYFGYGGPGDYCNLYDPSCSHIDWSKWTNRYIFTHQALSKLFANDVGGATSTEIEHVGLNRFINKLTSLTIPTRSATVLNAYYPNSDYISGQNISMKMELYHGYSDYRAYMPSNYKYGYYMSDVVVIADSESSKNGISITHKSTDKWTFFYWTSKEDYSSRGVNNPRVLGANQTVNLTHSARFRIGVPASSIGRLSYTFEMIQNPVSYLWVDTSEMFNTDKYQDFSAVVYHGTKGTIRLTETPEPQGSLKIIKTDSISGQAVPNATYGLYADEDLISAQRTVYKKDTLVDQITTDQNGSIQVKALIPGKYYLKELKAPDGYLLDQKSYPVTVAADITNTSQSQPILEVCDIPVDQSLGKLTIIKSIRAYDVIWAHGNPTFQFCVEGTDTAGKKYQYCASIEFDERQFGQISDSAYENNDKNALLTQSVTISEIPYGTYRVKEYNSLRYYLASIEGNTPNVSVVNLLSPHPNLLPEEVGYAQVILSDSEPSASVSFFNEKAYQQDYSHNSYVENYIPVQPRQTS